MQEIRTLAIGLALGLSTGAAYSDVKMEAAGQQVIVREDGSGGAALIVNGAILHENGVIYLDPEPQVIGGVTVVTGAAGAGGNACNPAPFVLALPDDAPPEFWGPLDSCAYFTPRAEGDRVVFASDPVPGAQGESWIWNRAGGFVPGSTKGFAATKGWEGLDGLAGAHPVEALAIAPVLEALQAGLGADYPAFAERISELGSGDLTPGGYRGEACLKFTCEADFAVLYIDRATRQVYVVWHVMGDIENRIWPQVTNLWPEEAMQILRDKAGP